LRRPSLTGKSPEGEQAALSNALAWSPDGRAMYHGHPMTGEINAWDFDTAKHGDLRRPRPAS
jgi:sugar lactone lactonase YvrE